MIWFVGFVVAATLGALFRYLFLLQWSLHWGTMGVNLIGSLLIGFLAIYLDRFSPQLKILVLVAFLGSLTTFSSYAFDLVKLFEQGQWGNALLYATASNFLCFLGCLSGWKLGQAWFSAA